MILILRPALSLLSFVLLLHPAYASPFERATPESQGVSSNGLRAMSEWIRSEELDVRSLIVLRNGKLILEWYAGDVTPEMNHNTFSVTKSIVSAICGIAVSERRLQGLEATLGETLNFPSPLGEITLEDLLTMRSGLPQSRGNEPIGAKRELFDRITNAPDRLQEIATLKIVNPSGKTFAYSNIDPQLVSAMIEKAYSAKITEVAKVTLFKPLDFSSARWFYPDERGLYPGGYGLRLRPIDMAKLGQLYLQEGEWNGQRILPTSWILDSVADHTGKNYGYYWWTGIAGDKSFAAKGVRGQQILVIPNKQLVFVVTANLPPNRVKPILNELNNTLLSASASKFPLPENIVANAALQKELSTAADYFPSHRNGLPKSRMPRMPLDGRN